MSRRTWTDRRGLRWEIRVRTRSEWTFVPMPGNPGTERPTRAPSWQEDPFELSAEELQRLFDEAPDPSRPRPPSPFRD
jgi:hypothetical protein